MTQKQHYDLWEIHRTLASTALKTFVETGRKELWQEYKTESRLANKHWVIAQAMFTRRYGRVVTVEI